MSLPLSLPFSLALYRAATTVLEPFAPLLLERRAKAGKEDRARLNERLARPTTPRPAGRLVWLHGASVGESLSILPLIDRLRVERPDATILVTSGTVTSATLLARRLPAGAIHQYLPVDTPGGARRFLDHWRPDLAVFVESELWPNLLLTAKARGVRLALVSAKLSDNSYARWQAKPFAAGRLLGGFDLILAQDGRAAERLTSLGGTVAGEADLKFGAAPLPADEAALADLRARLGDRPLLLAASTHAGEDEIVLAAWRALSPRPRLVIAPRHVERGPAIAEAARATGAVVALRSLDPAADAEVIIADTLGELGLWCRLADLALVAGSLVAGVGGHNPLEPARLNCPIVSGPHVENWLTAYADLRAVDGATFADASVLGERLARMLVEPEILALQATRAQAFVTARDGEARAGLDRILALLPSEAGGMKLATPRWWYRREDAPSPVTRLLLTPLSWIWAAQTAKRIARAQPRGADCAVICVGNFTVGGVGKTPVVRELLLTLTKRGRRAHGLSRGYGGKLKGPVQVDRGRHTAVEVGDEPLMLAQDFPIWVARDRVAGARRAAAMGAEVVVMDDGHQNPDLRKTLSLVVVDGETREDEWPFGDGKVFPAGPMREPLVVSLVRTDAVIVLLPSDLPEADPELLALFGDTPVLIARLEPAAPPPAGRQVGFAGIGKPWKVERALKAAGCHLVDFAPYPDHGNYDEATLQFLAERAATYSAGLVTTEKDWVRLPQAWRDRVTPWPVRARFEDEAALGRLLESAGL